MGLPILLVYPYQQDLQADCPREGMPSRCASLVGADRTICMGSSADCVLATSSPEMSQRYHVSRHCLVSGFGTEGAADRLLEVHSDEYIVQIAKESCVKLCRINIQDSAISVKYSRSCKGVNSKQRDIRLSIFRAI